MIFGVFDAQQYTDFAEIIFSEIQRSFPNTQTLPTPKSLEKNRKKLDEIITKAKSFAQKNNPNIYKKAKFLNALKWKLADSGHDRVFVDEILRLLANAMN